MSAAPGRVDPALVVVLAGVSAALHVGKLPPAIPVLRDALDINLVQAGFLLSLVQLAGMALGLLVGLAADGWGLRRTLLIGLLVLGSASALGGLATDASALLVLRAFEGLGFLLAVMPAPGLIRRLVEPARMGSMLGLWGAYMPFGTALALLLGPGVMAWAGWAAWWWLLALLSFVFVAWVWRTVPQDPPPALPHQGQLHAVSHPVSHPVQARSAWAMRLGDTLRAPGPWLVAVCFALYSGQWLAVIGFLPVVYTQAGIASGQVALLTALVASVNMLGNIASGRLLHRGIAAHWLLAVGFVAMAVGAGVAFGGGEGAGAVPPAIRYAAVLVFSAVGGVIPGTLFSLAVRLAPGEHTISTTVGFMQQCSALGQFLGPPLVAALAAAAGGWQWTWLATGACCLVGLGVAGLLARHSNRSP